MKFKNKSEARKYYKIKLVNELMGFGENKEVKCKYYREAVKIIDRSKNDTWRKDIANHKKTG